jgi:hypothetical protein
MNLGPDKLIACKLSIIDLREIKEIIREQLEAT